MALVNIDTKNLAVEETQVLSVAVVGVKARRDSKGSSGISSMCRLGSPASLGGAT